MTVSRGVPPAIQGAVLEGTSRGVKMKRGSLLLIIAESRPQLLFHFYVGIFYEPF